MLEAGDGNAVLLAFRFKVEARYSIGICLTDLGGLIEIFEGIDLIDRRQELIFAVAGLSVDVVA